MDPGPIEEFLSTIGGVPETRHGYYRSLKALYRFICRRNRLQNPIELIDPPSRSKKLKPTLGVCLSNISLGSCIIKAKLQQGDIDERGLLSL